MGCNWGCTFKTFSIRSLTTSSLFFCAISKVALSSCSVFLLCSVMASSNPDTIDFSKRANCSFFDCLRASISSSACVLAAFNLSTRSKKVQNYEIMLNDYIVLQFGLPGKHPFQLPEGSESRSVLLKPVLLPSMPGIEREPPVKYD